MKYLLDVNVLVAWGWADHLDHTRAASWIASVRKKQSARICTSAIPELGFIRVSAQRAAGRLPMAVAAKVLAGLIESLGDHHSFLRDDQTSVNLLPAWCQSASRTTDAHLVQLAAKHGLVLATLDAQIPGAFLIPVLPQPRQRDG